MPFHLAEIQKEDCTEFAILDEAAGAHWPLARAMEHGKASRQEMFEQWFHGSWGKNPSLRWMKVIDSESGEMAAGALWRFVLESAGPKDNAETKENAVKENAKQQAGDVNEIPPVFLEMGKRWKDFQDEFIGDQRFASKSLTSQLLLLDLTVAAADLQVLVAHPKYQRKGAGSMLVKYGCDIADEKGIPCALTASDAGHSLYLRHGFEVKRTSEMDLRPYGVDATELRRGMVRPARGK